MPRPDSSFTPAQQCAENILDIAESRDHMTLPQQTQMIAMARMLTPEQIKRAGRFVSVLREVAEWGQE